MGSLTETFILSLVFSLVTYSQGLQFSMGPPDDVYCGHLQCWADKYFTDTSIFSIISLAVYDITHSNVSVKLSVLSLFDPDIYVDESQINVIHVTGKISSKHVELTLSFLDARYCLNSYFVCEMDFVNASGQPHVIRETVSPGSSENCYDNEREIVELREQNLALKRDLENALHELSVLKELQNTTCDTVQNDTFVTCFKGMPHSNSREHFLLWGKVAALCDTETDGGGWIVIQRRTKGDVDFYRGWEDYKIGFGTPDTDFWIGNDIIHSLTSQNYTELRIDMEYQGRQYYAQYSHFDVANETSLYRLSESGYKGTAGDYLYYNNGRDFSTFDKDNDIWVYGDNCASDFHGAWWYNGCSHVNLNGMWGALNSSGLSWTGIVYLGSVSFSEMKIRLV